VSAWSPWPDRPPPRAGHVDICRVRLDQPGPALAACRGVLDNDELARADRFRFPVKRNEFTLVRGALRLALAQLLDCDPEDIRFRYGPHAKPDLQFPRPPRPLHFNVSHSHGLALLAFADDRAVGVDIEKIRPRDNLEKLVNRFFSPTERRAFAALPPDQRTRAFFEGWVRKEAFIKARGEGVTLGLDRFDVSLTPSRPAALLATPFDPPEADRWSMTGIDPGPDHIAAAVVEGADPRWRLWEMPPIVLP